MKFFKKDTKVKDTQEPNICNTILKDKTIDSNIKLDLIKIIISDIHTLNK